MKPDLLLTAARLGNPWDRSEPPPITPADAVTLAEMLTRNKASFLQLERKYGSALRGTALGTYIDRERSAFDISRNEFERIRLDLQRAGIETILFKSAGLFPSFTHLSSNLDVLVRPDKGDAARKRLHALGYAELLNVEEPAKFLFRRFLGGDTRFTFHLHEQVGWGVPFVDTDAVWANAEAAPDDDAIRIPGPQEALLITTAHWFYEDKALSLQNLFFTAASIRRLKTDIAAVGRSAASRGWEDGFYTALKAFNEAWSRLFGEDGLGADDLAAVERYIANSRSKTVSMLSRVRYGAGVPATVPFLENKVVYYRKVFGDRKRPAGVKTADFVKTILWAIRWKLHIRSQPPLLIALSGCDGSGKSVQAQRLETVFETCDVRVRTVWARGASSPLMAGLIRLAKALTPSRNAPGVGNAKGAAGRSTEASKMAYRREQMKHPVRRFLFAFLYALDLAFVYGAKVRCLLAAGYVVIADRYVDDGLVDFAVMSGVELDRLPFPMRALRALCPRPHAAFVLDVDEREALRRKPEEGDVAHLREARALFRQIAAARGGHVVAAGLTEDEVQNVLSSASLEAFYRRYRTLINRLLASDPEQLNPGRWRYSEEARP